jgi:hypothetical protein
VIVDRLWTPQFVGETGERLPHDRGVCPCVIEAHDGGGGPEG